MTEANKSNQVLVTIGHKTIHTSKDKNASQSELANFMRQQFDQSQPSDAVMYNATSESCDGTVYDAYIEREVPWRLIKPGDRVRFTATVSLVELTQIASNCLEHSGGLNATLFAHALMRISGCDRDFQIEQPQWEIINHHKYGVTLETQCLISGEDGRAKYLETAMPVVLENGNLLTRGVVGVLTNSADYNADPDTFVEINFHNGLGTVRMLRKHLVPHKASKQV